MHLATKIILLFVVCHTGSQKKRFFSGSSTGGEQQQQDFAGVVSVGSINNGAGCSSSMDVSTHGLQAMFDDKQFSLVAGQPGF